MIKCKVCKFWDKSKEDYGLCRVLPPAANDAIGHGVWPSTLETDSCGAGKPK